MSQPLSLTSETSRKVRKNSVYYFDLESPEGLIGISKDPSSITAEIVGNQLFLVYVVFWRQGFHSMSETLDTWL